MKKKFSSSLDVYINRVFKTLIISIPIVALIAGLTFSIIKISGFYPEVSLRALLIFDASCVVYFLIGLYFLNNCEDSDGNIKPQSLKYGKIFILVLIFIQWNFISYMIPSRDFWAYAFLFIIVGSFFLDHKMLTIAIAEVVISMFISWIVRPQYLLPVRDELFIPEMILRIILIVLGLGCQWLVTRAVEIKLATELERIADYDTLTLLFNRRKLEQSMEKATEAEESTGKKYSVLMIDIDDFKMVNDKYGHDCGDQVLINISDIIRSDVGKMGTAFRYGGEEILVLVHEDEQKTVEIAETIRRDIENMHISYDGNDITVTVTIGVATHKNGDTNDSLFKRADSNLYYGKTHGKNCVIK